MNKCNAFTSVYIPAHYGEWGQILHLLNQHAQPILLEGNRVTLHEVHDFILLLLEHAKRSLKLTVRSIDPFHISIL